MAHVPKPLADAGSVVTAAGATALGAAWSHSPEQLRHVVRRAGDIGSHQLQRYLGDWNGIRYRLSGRHPDADVDDATLADRVRSELGPVIKSLDVPHVHVMSEDHVILLHGEVGSTADAEQIERAVRAVSGVDGIESYLHVGLLASDTRPSQSRPRPSSQRQQLVAAAREAGVPGDHAEEATRAVLATFAQTLPDGERAHLLSHLPADVRRLTGPPTRKGARRRVRTVAELVDTVTRESPDMPAGAALAATGAVLHALRAMVPEERRDISAVLPAELRELWAEDGTAG
jgi:uncharacterized protein (DUF2267 family)